MLCFFNLNKHPLFLCSFINQIPRRPYMLYITCNIDSKLSIDFQLNVFQLVCKVYVRFK